MMSLSESNSLPILIALLALFIALCAVVFFVALKKAQSIDRQMLQETKQMQRLLQGQLVVMGQRVLALEQSLRAADRADTGSASEHRPVRTPAPGSVKMEKPAFDFDTVNSQPSFVESGDESNSGPEEDLTALAQQLLEAGESPVYVAERCNLSQSEMDLLKAMCKPSSL